MPPHHTNHTMYRIAKIHPDAIIPRKGTAGSAGYDLHALDEVNIPPHDQVIVPTGLMIEIPEDTYARIAPRSGLAVNHRLHVMAGVVDASYRGEIKVVLANLGNEPVHLPRNGRIAQLILERIATDDFVEVPAEELTQTERGAGGFGSTGITS